MTIVDRYLCSVFLSTFLICFLSFAGLFTVVHLFSNLDELNTIADKVGWAVVFQEFYLPRVADIYDKSTGVLILISAVFAVSLLQRRREMTAMEAAGLTKLRILRPIFVLSIIFVGLTIANREFLIPRLKAQLVRTPQSWGDTGRTDMSLQTDVNNITIQGDHFYFTDQRISNIQIELPASVTPPTAPLRAKSGFLRAATHWRPAGIMMDVVTSNIESLYPSIQDADGQLTVYTPANHDWLSERQLFVRCDFSRDQIAFEKQQEQYQSTTELIASANQPRRWSTGSEYVSIHARLILSLIHI